MPIDLVVIDGIVVHLTQEAMSVVIVATVPNVRITSVWRQLKVDHLS